MPQQVSGYTNRFGTWVDDYGRKGSSAAIFDDEDEELALQAARAEFAAAVGQPEGFDDDAEVDSMPALDERDDVAESCYGAVRDTAEKLVRRVEIDPRDVGRAAASVPGVGVLRTVMVTDIVTDAYERKAGLSLSARDAHAVREGVESVMGEDSEDALQRLDAAYDRIEAGLEQMPPYFDADDCFMGTHDAVNDAAGYVMTRAEVDELANNRAMSSYGQPW